MEISNVIVGQDKIIEKLILALLSNGHVLLEGVPGLAKTLLIKTLSECINSDFVRLQFTPDLLPADIIGTKIYDHISTSFKTIQGPIFSNFVLADEINRAPPKVQSALLEAMQEKQVSIQGETFALPNPFFVMATQNPIESEGTYRLPEAQVDRFMFKLLMSYPQKEEESKIIKRFTEGINVKASKIISAQQLVEIQNFNQKVYADQKIHDYVAQIVDATRYPENYGLDIDNKIEFGASPRASIWLTLGAKSKAILCGRGYVIPQDIQDIAHDVLRHRILLTYEAEAEDITTDHIIKSILEKVPVP
jgi:MoxR-like ATPase